MNETITEELEELLVDELRKRCNELLMISPIFIIVFVQVLHASKTVFLAFARFSTGTYFICKVFPRNRDINIRCGSVPAKECSFPICF